MSQWTHIRGGFELTASPYEFKGKDPDKHFGSKNAYLPYPEEQLKIDAPRPHLFNPGKNKDPEFYLEFRAYLYSLPRAKKYIEEAFQLLPQGETGIIYSINQTVDNGRLSSSSFNYPCDEKAFKKALEKMYTSEDSWYTVDYQYLKQGYHAELDMIETIDGIVIGIRDDVRYCSGEEMLEGLEKFFNYLREHDIEVEDGYLEWEDEYVMFSDKPYYYCWRQSRISDDWENLYTFYKIEHKTNKILWSKTYHVPYTIKKRVDEDGKEYEYKDIEYHSKEVVIEEQNFEETK